jgi:hypothetical protein
MKKILLAAIICASTIGAGCSVAEDKVYPYPFNSARIEYTAPGSTEPTTIITIKGDKQLFQTSGEQNTLMIINKDKISYINLSAKTGTTSQNQTYAELKKLPKEERMNYLMSGSLGLKETKNGQNLPAPSGQKQIAGQTCDIYENGPVGNTCMWDGIPLEIISSAAANEDSTQSPGVVATKIEVNIEVPDSTFDIPQGVELKDLSA